MTVLAGHRVQYEQPTAVALGLRLDRSEQRRADAVPPRGTMHQHFLHVGAMRLVWRRIQSKLDGADNFSIQSRGEQYSVPVRDGACGFREECERFLVRKRRHERDAGAAFDAIDQNIRQLIGRGFNLACTQRNDFGACAHAARSSLVSTVASALSR